MAPGVNGSGKHTGTVPKSKTQNDGRRESDNRRDTGINNMSNNLAPFEWQQIPESSQSSSLKPSNTRACGSDCYDIDGAVSHDIDNRRRRVSDEQGVQHPYLPFGYPPASVKPTPNPRQLRQNAHRLTFYSQPLLHSSHVNQPHAAFQMMMASDEEEGASSFDSVRFQQLHSMNERNGGAPEWVDQGGSGEGRASRERTSPSGSEPLVRGGSKPRDERDRNILPERENKSNVSKMPDRNQVLSRLNQIRDYINQTTSLMDRMQHSRDPRVAAEYCKLTKMLLGLRDSEKKLEDLLSTLKNLAECGEIDISGGCVLESVDYEHLQRFSQLLEVLKKQEDMYLHLCSRHWGKMKQSNPEVRRMAGQPGRNISQDNEMNSQVANASYHPSDMASSVTKSAEAGHRNELRAKLQKTELEQPVQNEGVSTSQDFSRSPVAEAPVIGKEKLDHLKERIQALKELYENRNQLMELLGDEDDELSSEHHALQNKLEDLQQKKSQMDQLVQELRSLNSFIPDEDAPEALNEPLGNEAPQELGSAENETDQHAEHDIQEVLKNMEELKHMKERLAVLQGMMHVTASQSQASGGGSVGNDGAGGPDKEDNSVNIRREVENSREAANSSKPDNISLSSEAGSIPNSDARQLYLSTQELERKTLKLQEAKLRLQQLEKLLDVMQDNRKESASLTSEHYSQLLQSVGDGEEAAGGDNTVSVSKEPDLLVNVADDQSLHSNSRKSSRKKYGSVPTDEAGSFHGSQQAQQIARSRSSSTRGGEDERRQNRAPSPLSTELSVEALQAMTQSLREQAMTIRSERDRLAAVKWQIAQRQRAEAMPSSPPPSSSASSSSASSFVRRVKNRNAMSIDTQSCRQMFLQAELQAKRRELEELMRKDRGHQTSINQDICSEISAGKSEAPGFSHVTVEGTTTNATWGDSTQGTLDDLVERDIEVQDQSGGYSSDEGRNDDEAKEGTHFHQPSSFQDQRISQLNVTLAREQQNIRSQSAQRDLLNISLDSQGRQKTSIHSNNSTSNTSCTLSNVNSSSLQGVSRSSRGRSPVRGSQGQIQQPQVHSAPSRNQVPTSHNVWKKESQEGVPRAVWTPSVHARQENLCSADELAADSSANSHAPGPPSSFPSAPSSLHHMPQSNPSGALHLGPSWWQQQAQHLQSQLEATSSLCQSLMSEQQHHSGGQGCTLPPGLPGGPYNLAHPHPIGFATPPAPPSWPFPNMTPPWLLTPTSIFPGSDHSPSSFTLHSCASHQLQQQQVLLTLSQCCHLLWLQHRELASLQATVQGIQERVGHEPRPPANQDEDDLRNMQMQQHPQLQQPHVLPHSVSYPNRVTTPNSQTSFPAPISVAQPMPVRVGAGMVAGATLKGRPLKPSHPPASFPEAGQGMIPSDSALAHGIAVLGAASGVSSAHSLPNLCASGAPMMGLPHLLPQTTDPHLTSPGSSYPFPTDHHLPPPPPPPHGATSYSHADHWALHPGNAARGPPVALNNQVPPGIRANNYWDNFRSYSRQNLLSTNSKTNEGPHIPSPLVMRSHNFLRTASHGPPIPAAGLNASPVPVSQSSRLSMPIQKEKLNSEQQQSGSSVQPNTNFMAQTSGLGSEAGALYDAVGFSAHDVPWESQQSPQASHTKDDHMSMHDESGRRHSSRERVGLFEVLRESVYSEVATLIAQNENRPHYLIQLFRDLQMISCDALRQRTLHTIHRIVSRYLQENGKEMLSEQPSTSVVEPDSELGLKGDCDSSGDEDTAERTYRVPEEVVNYGGSCDHHSVAESKQLVCEPISIPESHGHNEAVGLALHLKKRESLDGNILSMLEQLLPLLKPHLDEPSSFMLLQNICLLAFQFLSSSINANSNKSKDNVVNTSMPFHQLNSLLEETCHSFEGCKLKDVGEELLISIGEVIIKAISSSNNVGPSSRKIPEDIEETDEESLEANAGSGPREAGVGEGDGIEAEMEVLHGTCCDDDLAEADQSLGSGVGANAEAIESAREDLLCDEASALPKGNEAESSPYVGEEALIILDGQRLESDQRSGEHLIVAVDESNNAESCHKNEAILECNGNNENDDASVAEALIDSMSISSDEVKNPAVIKADQKFPVPNADLAHSNCWEDEEEVAVAAEEDINKNTQGDAGGNF